MFKVASFSRSSVNSLATICRRMNTLSISNSNSLNPILFSLQSSNSNVNKTTYKCPEKIRGFNGIVGDEKIEKNPIFDFMKTDITVCNSITNTPILIPEVIKRIQDQAIITSIMYEQNKNKSYDLPTHKSTENIQKQADYFKHYYNNRFTSLLWIRHRKMKKHQRIKWRKSNLAMIKRRLLERNIAKEKIFRAELLNQIREAENFDPEEYVKNILRTIDNVPKAETPRQRYERYIDLIRKNRTQTHLVKPKFED